MLTRKQIDEDVKQALDDVLFRHLADGWKLQSGDASPEMICGWERETLPAIQGFCAQLYYGNQRIAVTFGEDVDIMPAEEQPDRFGVWVDGQPRGQVYPIDGAWVATDHTTPGERYVDFESAVKALLPVKLKRVVAVLDVEDEEGIDRVLIEAVPTIKAVVSVTGVEVLIQPRFAVGDRATIFPEGPIVIAEVFPRGHFPFGLYSGGYEGREPIDGQFYGIDVDGGRYADGEGGEVGEADLTPASTSLDEMAREEIASSFFEDYEPGTVPEEKYQEILSEVKNAANYLTNEPCYRVEYNIPWGQNERVSWVEASSEEDARGDESKLPVISAYGVGMSTQVRIVSCRRATVKEDLEEYFEGLAREMGWNR